MAWDSMFELVAQLEPVVAIFSHNRTIKKCMNELVAGLDGERYWRINMVRPSFFERWLRMTPFEAQGVLIDEGDQLRLKGFGFGRDKTFDMTMDKSQCNVQWYGNQGRRTGNLYWAKLSTACGPLLFCADAGRYASREALADILHNVFPQLPLPAKPPTWRWKRPRAP